MGIAEYDFGDLTRANRSITWVEQPDGSFLDTQQHTFTRYGTYSTKLVLKNNVSSLTLYVTIEIEQCVENFGVLYLSSEYVCKTTEFYLPRLHLRKELVRDK